MKTYGGVTDKVMVLTLALVGVSGHFHALTTLPLVPIGYEAGGPQNQSGRHGEKNEASKNYNCGHAIAQVVSHWLPTVAAQVRSCGICGGQSDTGAGFFRVLQFPLPISIPPIAPQSPSPIMWGWYSSPVVATVLSGLVSPH
jgi:hypothetical protein